MDALIWGEDICSRAGRLPGSLKYYFLEKINIKYVKYSHIWLN